MTGNERHDGEFNTTRVITMSMKWWNGGETNHKFIIIFYHFHNTNTKLLWTEWQENNIFTLNSEFYSFSGLIFQFKTLSHSFVVLTLAFGFHSTYCFRFESWIQYKQMMAVICMFTLWHFPHIAFRPLTSFQLLIVLIARGEKQKLPKFIDK